jgi:hypothetical protein
LRALILCHIVGVFIMLKNRVRFNSRLAGKALQRVGGNGQGALPVFYSIENQVPFFNQAISG